MGESKLYPLIFLLFICTYSQVCYHVGYQYLGVTLNQSFTTSAADCSENCSNNTDCSCFSWSSYDGNCTLHELCSDTYQNKTFISGSVNVACGISSCKWNTMDLCVETSLKNCDKIGTILGSLLGNYSWNSNDTCPNGIACTNDFACFKSSQSFCTFLSNVTGDSWTIASSCSTYVPASSFSVSSNISNPLCSRYDLVTCSTLGTATALANITFDDFLHIPTSQILLIENPAFAHNFTINGIVQVEAGGQLIISEYLIIDNGSLIIDNGGIVFVGSDVLLTNGSLGLYGGNSLCSVSGNIYFSTSTISVSNSSTIYIANNFVHKSSTTISYLNISNGGQINITQCADIKNIFLDISPNLTAIFMNNENSQLSYGYKSKQYLYWNCVIGKFQESLSSIDVNTSVSQCIIEKTPQYFPTGFALLFIVNCTPIQDGGSQSNVAYSIEMEVTALSSTPTTTITNAITEICLRSFTIKSLLLIKVDAFKIGQNETHSMYNVVVSFTDGVADILTLTLPKIIQDMVDDLRASQTVQSLANNYNIFLEPYSVRIVVATNKVSSFIPVVIGLSVALGIVCIVSWAVTGVWFNTQKKFFKDVPFAGDEISADEPSEIEDAEDTDKPILVKNKKILAVDTDEDYDDDDL